VRWAGTSSGRSSARFPQIPVARQHGLYGVCISGPRRVDPEVAGRGRERREDFQLCKNEARDVPEVTLHDSFSVWGYRVWALSGGFLPTLVGPVTQSPPWYLKETFTFAR
jgi:hypothetical protein